DKGRHLFPPEQTIRSIKLYHRQIYRYAFHRPKLEFLHTGEIDDKRAGDTRFSAVGNFLEAVPLICPHDLFRAEEHGRASQAHPDFANVSRIIVNRKENIATRIASLIIPAVGNNKLRHETLQRFMLTNDSVTVAIEVPIWLTETDITALEKQYGIELAPRVDAAERSITGHIDFLQVRNGAVHIRSMVSCGMRREVGCHSRASLRKPMRCTRCSSGARTSSRPAPRDRMRGGN